MSRLSQRAWEAWSCRGWEFSCSGCGSRGRGSSRSVWPEQLLPIPHSQQPRGLTGHIPAQGSALPGGLAQWHREVHFQLWLLGLQPASDSSQRLLMWGREELPKQRGEGAAAPKAPQGHIPCERRAQGILQPPCPGAEARLASRNCLMSNTHCRPQAFLTPCFVLIH